MTKPIVKIERCRISGFKSIRDADIVLGPLNVFIGANGAGKSNLVSFFALLRDSLDGRMDGHVGRGGGPNAFLYLGSRVTNEINCALTATTDAGRGILYQRLEFQAPDNLVYGRVRAGGRRVRRAPRARIAVFTAQPGQPSRMAGGLQPRRSLAEECHWRRAALMPRPYLFA